MDVTVQRTESDRSQNGGPRVSFNRDVHVKRIGPRPPNTDAAVAAAAAAAASTTAIAPRRELSTDLLSEEGILKEAALVLAQADSVQCTAEGASNDVVGGRASVKNRGPIEARRTFDYTSNKIFAKDPNRFNSLPNRKSKPAKSSAARPVARSVSDASSLKQRTAAANKRPSIFSIFSRKSDSNLHDFESGGGGGGGGVGGVDTESAAGNSRGGSGSRKRVGRSKSDVGQQPQSKLGRRSNLGSNENDSAALNSGNTRKNAKPLSPIIEREDYFNPRPPGDNLHAESGSVSNPPPVVPRRDKRNGNRSIVAQQTKQKTKSGQENAPQRDQPEPSSSTDVIKDTIYRLRSPPLTEMHSSQLPPQKPPLTKGVTVDGMVKRLSMERFSPPPHLSGPAFSYTRPTEPIIYAHLETNGLAKQATTNGGGAIITPPSHRNADAVDGQNQQQHHHHQQRRLPNNSHTLQPSSRHRPHRQHASDDEDDEGLGLEYSRAAKAQKDDFIAASAAHERSLRDPRSASDDEFKLAAEDLPITPKIRDVPPEKSGGYQQQQQQQQAEQRAMRGRADGMDERAAAAGIAGEIGDLSSRRVLLESRMKSRRFGSRDVLNEPEEAVKGPLFNGHSGQPHLHREYPTGEAVRMTMLPATTHQGYVKRLSPPSRDNDEEEEDYRHRTDYQDYPSNQLQERYQRRSVEPVLNRYSPERAYLQAVTSGGGGDSAVTKKFNNGPSATDGYPETVRRGEFKIGPDGRPRLTERVQVDRLDPRDFEGGDDELRYKHQQQGWRSSSVPSRRHEKLQRSFDRGDSGIENDYRKDSFTDRDIRRRWQQRTYDDDRRACDLFLRKERRHTADNHTPSRWRTAQSSYRERSIDDGSHFDPHLDRYEVGTLERRSRDKSVERSKRGTLDRKRSGLEKVKQLLSGGSSKKSKSPTATAFPSPPPSTIKSSKLSSREKQQHLMAGGGGADEDHRSKLSDENSFDEPPPQIPDISTRRRLSTPKASPALPKRSASQKSSPTSEQPPKLSWFKSLDRLSRKKNKTASATHTLPPSSSSRSALGEDRLKARSELSVDHLPKGGQQMSKTLRFFGDTDLESNASHSKRTTSGKIRQPLPISSSSKAHSKSAYDLDTIKMANPSGKSSHSARHRSASLQHLVDETDRSSGGPQVNGRYNSKSRNLHDISESASDNDLAAVVTSSRTNLAHKKSPQKSSSLLSGSSVSRTNHFDQLSKPRSSRQEATTTTTTQSSTLTRNGHHGGYGEEDRRRSQSVDAKSSTMSRSDYRKPPMAPQKPARTFERRRSMSRGERDRVQDSSGTEGDSSQMSQRSVVYLHATTVGDIPRPAWLSSRSQTASRESLSSKPNKNQPMTRTVTRSYSMLSPWTPKHFRDGYEINYSQQSNPHQSLKSHHAKATHKQGSSATTKSKTRSNNNTNTLTRYKKNNTPSITTTSTLPRRMTGHESNSDKSLKSSKLSSGYRPAPAAAMDRPVERRILQRSSEEPAVDRYTSRRNRQWTPPEPVSVRY